MLCALARALPSHTLLRMTAMLLAELPVRGENVVSVGAHAMSRVEGLRLQYLRADGTMASASLAQWQKNRRSGDVL